MSPLRRALLALAMFAVCLLPGVARAQFQITTEWCFEYALDYTDGATGDMLTGSTTAARGAKVRFYDENFGTYVWSGYLSYDSPNAGCILMDGNGGTVQLLSNHEYTVEVLRDAILYNGNRVVVQSSGGGTYIIQAVQNLQPVAWTKYWPPVHPWTVLGPTDSTQIMAAAKFALQRRWAGLSNETFTFRNAPCNGTGNGSCYDYANELIWIADADRKFHLLGMMGYAVSHFANAHDAPLYSGSADMDDCIPGSPYTVNTKEYGSRNAVQAFAMFYSAVVLNDDGTNADCEYRVSYDVDWNADGDSFDIDEYETFSCSASPAPNQSPAIPDYAYFDYMQGCGGIADNRGTAYDWLKHLWDYRTDSLYGGHNTADIYTLFYDADPDTWVAAGDQSGSTQNYPYDRLYDAEGGGVFGDWNSLGEDRHGIHH